MENIPKGVFSFSLKYFSFLPARPNRPFRPCIGHYKCCFVLFLLLYFCAFCCCLFSNFSAGIRLQEALMELTVSTNRYVRDVTMKSLSVLTTISVTRNLFNQINRKCKIYRSKKWYIGQQQNNIFSSLFLPEICRRKVTVLTAGNLLPSWSVR